MDRLACVDVEPLRLQLLLLSQPSWQRQPVAVITKDGAEGKVLELNAEAARNGVSLDMRYATALSLCPTLCAREVTDEQVATAQRRLVTLLRRYSPDVEPFERGTMLVRASGMRLLTPDLQHWAGLIRRATMRHFGLSAAVGVGFGRLGAIVAARVHSRRRQDTAQPTVTFETPEEERRAVMAAPLQAFAGLPPKAMEQLRRLAVVSVGQLLMLPADGVLRRLGPEVHQLHRMATGAIDAPLAPQPEAERFETKQDIEPPERDAVRLLFRLKRLLGPLLRRARARQQMVRELVLTLTSERGTATTERLGAAEPTLDEASWVELLRLRLEHTPLDAGVGSVGIALETVRARPGQIQLLPSRERRKVEDADQGLARVRAEFGDARVSVAEIQTEHVPERQVVWRPLENLPPEATKRPTVAVTYRPASLVRRLMRVPVEPNHNEIEVLSTPSYVSWGWWYDPEHDGTQDVEPVDREYRYARMTSGAVLWLTREQTAGQGGRWRIGAVVE